MAFKPALVFAVSAALLSMASCKTVGAGSTAQNIQAPAGDGAGALIKVTAKSRVGVLLDEVPAAMRERVATALLAKDADYWTARAKRQLALTTYRLVFRGNYYKDKASLPLPPPQTVAIELGGAPKREKIEGHDYVVVDYSLAATLFSTLKSVGETEPALVPVGGTWHEPFVLPVDPELLLQRTDFACMNESEFPPNSVDTEDVEFFYDQECAVEATATPTGCHRSKLPTKSCADALSDSVGKIATSIDYERLAWDAGLAEKARVDTVTNPNGSDLKVIVEELNVNRVIYRYIPSDSCSIVESCVDAGGWRRLLQFNASEKDLGAEPVNIGDVDYYVTNQNTGAKPAIDHHIFEYSPCHHHYHFSHYGQATYEGASNKGKKRAFCLESVMRYSNNEATPLNTPYSDCNYQGIAPGWGDQYNAGLECQWIDVTSIDTHGGPVTNTLSFRSNPDGFLCEGKPVLDADGKPVFEPTAFKTAQGDTVDRPKCNFMKNWDDNNQASTQATVPQEGGGLITSECGRGQIGPLRNCGFTYQGGTASCTPGATVTLACSVKGGAADQVVRVCEASKALGVGVACAQADALANQTVAAAATLTFTCPAARDQTEPGGLYALYTGQVFPDDQPAAVVCKAR